MRQLIKGAVENPSVLAKPLEIDGFVLISIGRASAISVAIGNRPGIEIGTGASPQMEPGRGFSPWTVLLAWMVMRSVPGQMMVGIYIRKKYH